MISNVRAQMDREFITIDHHREHDGTVVNEHLIRVNFHCNQSCEFCFVSTHLPPMDDQTIRNAIVTAGQQHGKIVLTGGEPTLNPQLVTYVKLAREHSTFPINLQTNATRLNNPELLSSLIQAGLQEVFVSLHGSTAEISDAVTCAEGTFAKTVEGLDAIAKTALTLVINFVICTINAKDISQTVNLIVQRWPNAKINFSFVAASTDVVPHTTKLVPRYSDVLPELAKAMKIARDHHIEVRGFESMCGLPLCLVPDEFYNFSGFSDAMPDESQTEFVRSNACQQCSAASKCFGLRRGYAELYGVSELTPLTSPSAQERTPVHQSE